ncbi:hypothetical protein COV82_02025 [Candidatus Peregrinibacteria bacterium CG11_big_fil_rev_8_21_14_0_20_46_8]|nr:MAG: hypothetical protein COV82_02025 [Candidatus Peregrinibacteria bacterium CG11_big_fil_rev_8_21_14_0_20_46_8]
MWNPLSFASKGVRNSKANPKAATQLHMRIAEIRDNTVVLKTGGLRGVIKVSSVNFNLKSEEEQNAITFSYQSFLNTLEFPVQIVIRSRKLDLDNYLEALKEKATKQTNQLLQRQTFDYIDYIQHLIEYADIMEKEFYLVVPADPARSVKPNFIEQFWSRMHPADSIASIRRRHQEFNELKKQLTQRLATASSGLENCGLKTRLLNTTELVTLFYSISNPDTGRTQKVDDLSKNDVKSDTELGRT